MKQPEDNKTIDMWEKPPALWPPILQALTETWGPICPDYEPGCPTCEAWRLAVKYGRVPTDIEVFEEAKRAVP